MLRAPDNLARYRQEREIIDAHILLGLLDLQGALVPSDVLHCQGGTAKLIQERGGDWLFTLKANRRVQHAQVVAGADPHTRPEAEHVTTAADHGRDLRRCIISHDVDWLLYDRRHPDEARLPGLSMIGMVEATVTPTVRPARSGGITSPRPASTLSASPRRLGRTGESGTA